MPASPLSAGIDAPSYRDACSHFATGVGVATVKAGNGTPHGLTISSFTPVSISPPLILICISYDCTVAPHFISAHHFAVNVLTDLQRELSVAFAMKPEGRFENIAWHSGLTGAPLLDGSLATIECQVDRCINAGDHAVLFGLVVAAETGPGEPLLYYKRAYRTLG